MIWNQAAAKTRSCCSFRFLAAAVCSVFSTLCLPLQASAGSAVPAGRERRLLHHAPPGSPQGGPGLAGRLDPHQGHPQPPAHPGHRRPAPAAPTMTTAHCCTQTARTVTPHPRSVRPLEEKRGGGGRRGGVGEEGGMDSMNASRGLRPVQSLAKRMCHDGRWKQAALDPHPPEVRLLRYESPCFLIYSSFFFTMFAGTSAVRGQSRRGSCAVTTEPSSPAHILRANHPHPSRRGAGFHRTQPLLLLHRSFLWYFMSQTRVLLP